MRENVILSLTQNYYLSPIMISSLFAVNVLTSFFF